MKKVITLLLALVMVLSLAACGTTEPETPEVPETPAEPEVQLTDEEILSCCEQGYALGFRTFVLQGGETDADTDESIGRLVRHIKKRYS